MADTEVDKAFLGVGWSFPPEFHKHADNVGVRMVAEEEDIRESLKILLDTRPGERVMQPGYGCGLHAMVFETLSESAVTEIKDVIERAVLFYEPRITLEKININTDEINDGRLLIRLDYIVRRTNNRSNVVYPFYTIEGSLVRV
jgi:phage baseplate assembly protein W